jgi:hypothetical protein
MRGMISHHCQVRAWLPLWVLALSALALAAVLVGCGQPAAESPSPANRQPDAATTRQPSPTDGISRVAADQIAPLGDPLPPLDGGRLRLSIPRDWTLPPRDKEFLVRMQAQLNDPYPSILLTGDDSIGMDELTARNVRDLADRTQVALDEELTAQGARLTGAVEPLRTATGSNMAGRPDPARSYWNGCSWSPWLAAESTRLNCGRMSVRSSSTAARCWPWPAA